jgi:hypothetical protein
MIDKELVKDIAGGIVIVALGYAVLVMLMLF